jgi:hypothetical protein
MAEEHCKLGKIYWSEAFPFVRLFSTFKRAISFRPLVLAFCCVLLSYFCGRVLDAIWKGADAGVLVIPAERFANEIAAYAAFDSEGFEDWKRRAEQRLEAARAAGEEATTAEHEQQHSQLLALIDERLAKGLGVIDDDAEAVDEEKEQRRGELRRAAEVLRFWLAGYDADRIAPQREHATAIETILAADPEVAPQQRMEEQGRFVTMLARQRRHTEYEGIRPRGPFISLLNYEMRCFAAAIQGVCSGKWGLSGSALGSEPAMIGSIASAGSGVCWLVTQRPWFSVFLALVLLVVYAFFGGAICRVAAVQSAREESVSLRQALGFSREKFAALFAAPLLPVGIFVVAGVLVFMGGLVSAIPRVGEVLAGPLYVLSLLGGIALAFAFLAVVLGFHLMWPTIAVEGSDAFDAVQRAAGYVIQRAWHVAFYSFVLLLYGGISFVIVRIIAMLMFKLSHFATGLGMNLVNSARTETVGKLDAIWQMPAWQDLPLLPAMGGVSFWGDLGTAPLNGSESFAMVFFALWVFVFVGLVGAFVVSFYFCGSTEMYLLLRREVDAVDYDEVYYEEPEEEWGEEEPEEAGAPEAAPPFDASGPEQSEAQDAGKPEEPADESKRAGPGEGGGTEGTPGDSSPSG